MTTRHHASTSLSVVGPVVRAVLLTAILGVPVLGNGGPFLVTYPGGDTGARGSMALLGDDLKPGREERLRVLKEDLTITFTPDPLKVPVREARPKGSQASPGAPADQTPAGAAPLLNPPLAVVTAAYTIENPTDERIEVDFGFPILRGIYMPPFSMIPRPDVQVQVRLDDKPLPVQIIPVEIISNSMIYGVIRQRCREVIEKGIAADPRLAALVAGTRTAGGDWDRYTAREALREYLTSKKIWSPGMATLLVEFASYELDPRPESQVRSKAGAPAPLESLASLTRANLGLFARIGEQKATQLFAELGRQFDPESSREYEAIFGAWGGDVRERSLDWNTGQLRPREISVDPAGTKATRWDVAASDPTVYARVDYLEAKDLTDSQKASLQTVLKHLPVVFTFAPMNLLRYHVSFEPRKTVTLTVGYRQFAFADTRDPATYQLAYVVHPASLWKDFGPIQLEIAGPPEVSVRTSVQTREAGQVEKQVEPDRKNLSFALQRGEVREKTGELFVAVEAESWRRYVQGRTGQARLPNEDRKLAGIEKR